MEFMARFGYRMKDFVTEKRPTRPTITPKLNASDLYFMIIIPVYTVLSI